MTLSSRLLALPWTIYPEESRFKKLVLWVFLVFAIFSAIIPMLPVPKVERDKVEEIPPRLAKLILEKRKPPEPIKTPEAPKKKAEKPKPKPKPKKKVEEPKQKKPEVKKPTARERAKSSGLLALADDLADLRDDPVLNSVKSSSKLQTGGNNKNQLRSERSLVTSNATATSGGINTATLSRATGGGSLSGRQTTKVSSPDGFASKSKVSRSGASSKAARSQEQVKLIFDRNKGKIHNLYNRELRKDPTLKGKVILQLVILPSGDVKSCKIISSDLNSPSLEKKLLARVKTFNFGAQNVETITVTYPIDFYPS